MWLGRAVACLPAPCCSLDSVKVDVLTPLLTDESQLRLLRLLERNPEASQRDIAHELGISLGKTNYCVKALMEKGLIKARNFLNSRKKVAYVYRLTPKGIEQRTRMTVKFLDRKQQEYRALREEIDSLRKEVRAMQPLGRDQLAD